MNEPAYRRTMSPGKSISIGIGDPVASASLWTCTTCGMWRNLDDCLSCWCCCRPRTVASTSAVPTYTLAQKVLVFRSFKWSEGDIASYLDCAADCDAAAVRSLLEPVG